MTQFLDIQVDGAELCEHTNDNYQFDHCPLCRIRHLESIIQSITYKMSDGEIINRLNDAVDLRNQTPHRELLESLHE
jgi:hypothetical protein